MGFNRNYLWIAYIPVKLHIVAAVAFGSLGVWIGSLWGINESLSSFLGMGVGSLIGIPLQVYKHHAREVIEKDRRREAEQLPTSPPTM